MPDFKTITIDSLISGKDNKGNRYLELFLKEYSQMFHTKVNPGCTKCLTDYLKKYQDKFKAMSNTCKYRLQAKYENIPLEFGSPILVNNGNITDEYAEKLLKHKNGERYFSVIPEADAKGKKADAPKKAVEDTEATKTVEAPKEEQKAKEGDDAAKDIAEKEAALVDAYIKAENALSALPENAHHMTAKSAKKAIEDAEAALADFREANGLIVKE